MSDQNLYKRAGIYWLRATVNGVECRESLHTDDIKDARKARDKRLNELKAARKRGQARKSWLEAVAQWFAHAEDQIAASTAMRYAVSLEQAKPYLSRYSVDQIDGQVIAGYMTARRKTGASAATIRRDLTAISRVLEYAEAMGWREGNPTLSKRRLLRERRDPIVLPEARNIEAVIEAAGPRMGAMIRAAWLTGCRQRELVTAKWIGFNDKARTLEVIGKGNKRRVITLSVDAWRHISSQPHTLGSDLIFCQANGEPFRQAASDFTHHRRKVASQSARKGRPFVPFRFHDLRHLFAVEALQSGMSIYDLQHHLGHTSVKTTEAYLEFLTTEQKAAVKAGSAQFVGTVKHR